MTTDDQILRFLRNIEIKLARLVEDNSEHKVRMTAIDEALAGINRRLDRIDQRLDLIEQLMEPHL